MIVEDNTKDLLPQMMSSKVNDCITDEFEYDIIQSITEIAIMLYFQDNEYNKKESI